MQSPAGAVSRGTAIEAGSLVIDNCLSRVFVAAYLLTSSAKQAEAVAAESIRKLDIDAIRRGRLSWKAVRGVIARGTPEAEQTLGGQPLGLPVELLRVSRLSSHLRQAYVLRVLMAMPRHYCAGLLRIHAEQLDANCSLAAQELARIATAEDPMEEQCRESA
jgi:hypothetical protein